MEEVWKDIKGYKGLYQISNNGKIFSIKRKLIKKTFINRNGYEYIDLYIKKKKIFLFTIQQLQLLLTENKRTLK